MLVSCAAEIWGFLWERVLPYVEGVRIRWLRHPYRITDVSPLGSTTTAILSAVSISLPSE